MRRHARVRRERAGAKTARSMFSACSPRGSTRRTRRVRAHERIQPNLADPFAASRTFAESSRLAMALLIHTAMLPGHMAQSVLSPAGVQASTIHQLWLVMFWTTAVVCVVVLAFIAAAVFRSARRHHPNAAPSSERSLTRAVWTATALTALILFILLVANVWAGRGLESAETASAITINIY